MSYFLLQAIEKNQQRKGKDKYSHIFEDIDSVYGKANQYFFKKGGK